MKVVGIIAEFNPFHNGHRYLIEQARLLSGADAVVIVMSGSFTQRGIPACMSKYDRTMIALQNGADLVLELPVTYSTATAEVFAHGGISILNSIGITDYVVFGSECGDIDTLSGIAKDMLNPDDGHTDIINEYLKSGLSYPAARAKAYNEYSDILNSPNNILGIEYLKAMLRLNSTITPLTVKRTGADYHSLELTTIASADAIRKALKEINDLSAIGDSVPDNSVAIMTDALGKTWPIHLDDFSALAEYVLLSHDSDSLSLYQDMNIDIANRFCKFVNKFTDISEFISDAKTKELTYTRINRALLHCILSLKDMTRDSDGNVIACPYTRILGFRHESGTLMHDLKANTNIPVIAKAGDAYNILSASAYPYFEETVKADRIYDAVVKKKYGTRPKDGCLISPVII